MAPPVLEAIGVSKRFPNGVQALTDIHLEVRRGETCVLIGESGCGKTTLLSLFNRLEDVSSGVVQVNGRPVSSLDPITLRRHTGYVQQEGGLLPHWTIERNVGLVPTLLGWNAERRSKRVIEMLKLVGLDPARYSTRYPNQLSGGQRQRVAFARALAGDPDVVLLDEPFGALDAITRHEIQTEFQRLKQQLHKTMLVVTHDLNEALYLGDRIVVLKQGRLQQVGTPGDLRRSPATPYVKELLSQVREVRS